MNKVAYIKSYGEESLGIVYELEDGSFSVCEVSQYGGEEQHLADFDANDFESAKQFACSFT
jgi:hypothetical protein